MRARLKPNQIEEARRMRESGQSWRAIGRAFSISTDAVMAAIDPIFAERRRQNIRDWRAKNGRGLGGRRETLSEWIDPALVPSVPRDTRGLTGYLMGDPLPGRSALDLRASQTTGR